jgi:hypothetical protein
MKKLVIILTFAVALVLTSIACSSKKSPVSAGVSANFVGTPVGSAAPRIAACLTAPDISNLVQTGGVLHGDNSNSGDNFYQAVFVESYIGDGYNDQVWKFTVTSPRFIGFLGDCNFSQVFVIYKNCVENPNSIVLDENQVYYQPCTTFTYLPAGTYYLVADEFSGCCSPSAPVSPSPSSYGSGEYEINIIAPTGGEI